MSERGKMIATILYFPM